MLSIKRLRHFHGHGIHSPFVYSLVRAVFMRREVVGAERELYDQLTECNVRHRSAVELQNLYTFCDYMDFGIGMEDGEFCVILLDKSNLSLKEMLTSGQYRDKTVVVISPRQDRERRRICEHMVEYSECMSIDRMGYLIFFYDKNLPVQHFKL